MRHIILLVAILLITTTSLALAQGQVKILDATEANGMWRMTVQGTDWQTLVLYPLPFQAGALKEVSGTVADSNVVFEIEPKTLIRFNFTMGNLWSFVDETCAIGLPDAIGIYVERSGASCYFFRKSDQPKVWRQSN